MKDKQFLMIPGPTPVPSSVLLEMAKHPIGHRSPEFSSILENVYRDLKWLFQTKNDVFVFTASGTGAMDAAISNLVNKGDKVLSLCMGNFGERWAKISEMYGAEVERITVPWGEAINPQVVKERLEQDENKEIKFVTVTHNETSTGVTNDIEEILKHIKAHGAISIVDTVTSVGAIDFQTDNWGADVVVSGSQKGFMVPPGLSFLTCSDKAFEVHEQCERPSFYFNFKAYRKAVRANSTPYTPNVSLIAGLKVALDMMKEEGICVIHQRHAKLARGLRAAVKALGLELFVKDEARASNAITSVLPPEGVSVPTIRKVMKDEFDIVIANGQAEYKDRIFRMGHLGFVTERDLIASVGALEMALVKAGLNIDKGAGTKALLDVLMED